MALKQAFVGLYRLGCDCLRHVVCGVANINLAASNIKGRVAKIQSETFEQFGTEVNDPAVNSGMMQINIAPRHHFFHIEQALIISQLPMNTKKDDRLFPMASFERREYSAA